MPKPISVGDLVIQKYVSLSLLGVVIEVRYGRTETPKNELDMLYEYARVLWIGGSISYIKTGLLKKIS